MEYVREAVCFFWYGIASLGGVLIPLSDSKNTKNKQAIVIVSGIGSQPLAFFFLKKYLEKRNFAVYFFRIHLLKTFGIGIKDITEIAQEIDDFLEKEKLSNVILLGMSAGGVASLLFLLSFEGKKIESRTKEVFALLRSLQIDHGKVNESLETLGKHLTNASGQYAQVTKGFATLGNKLSSTKHLEIKKQDLL